MKLILNTLALVILFTIGPCQAASENSDFSTKEEFINELKPKPKIKLRGIQLNGAENQEPTAPPSISMRVNFAFDSYALTDEIKSKLNPLGEALMSEQLVKYSFQISGHTDAVGHEDYNNELSGKRAVTVGQYLYDSFGVDPVRLQLAGFGEEQLLDSANPKSGENRRVEITTLVTAQQ